MAGLQISHRRAKLQELVNDLLPTMVVGFGDRCYRSSDRPKQVIERRVPVSTAARVAIADFLKFIDDLSHNNPPIDGFERGRIGGDPFEIDKSVHYSTLVSPILTADRRGSGRGGFVEIDKLLKSTCI